MKSIICLVAFVAVGYAQILLEDDGQWRPELDGSALGSGLDGQWNPLADGSLAGEPAHILKKRSAVLAAPLAITRITPAAALRHDAQIVTSAIAPATIVGSPLLAPHPIAHILKKRSAVLAAPLALTRITPAAALRHDTQIVTSAIAPATIVGTPLLAPHPIAHILKKRSAVLAAPLALTRITPAAALTHDAQIVASTGLVGAPLLAHHGVLGARTLLL